MVVGLTELYILRPRGDIWNEINLAVFVLLVMDLDLDVV